MSADGWLAGWLARTRRQATTSGRLSHLCEIANCIWNPLRTPMHPTRGLFNAPGRLGPAGWRAMCPLGVTLGGKRLPADHHERPTATCWLLFAVRAEGREEVEETIRLSRGWRRTMFGRFQQKQAKTKGQLDATL